MQISLGKTRSDPTCMHGLVTSNVAAKDHVTPLRGEAGLHSFIFLPLFTGTIITRLLNFSPVQISLK